MQIDYDNQVDAKYITFKKGKVVRTEPVEEWLNFDLAADESVIGIEILDASQHSIGVSTIGGEFVGYFEAEPRKIDSDSLDKTIPQLKLSEDLISFKEALTS